MNIDWPLVLGVLNGVTTAIFVVLVGLTLRKQGSRIRWYRRRGKPVPVILKRGFALMLAFLVLFGSGLFLRVTGLNVYITEPSLERFIYLLFINSMSIGVLGYYTKTEYIDVEDPNKS